INPDWLTAQTEAAVVASRALADQAVVRLDLAHNPSFNPALRPPDTGLIGTAEQWLDWIIGKLRRRGSEPGPALTNPSPNSPGTEALASLYLAGLEATPVGRSRLIRITFTAVDPGLAAPAANATAELYIESQRNAKGQATSEANTWLDRRVNEVHQQVIEAQQKRDDFRRKAGIVQLGDLSIYGQQLAQ